MILRNDQDFKVAIESRRSFASRNKQDITYCWELFAQKAKRNINLSTDSLPQSVALQIIFFSVLGWQSPPSSITTDKLPIREK